MPGDLGWLTTAEALARLRVRPQTLYAYVSRGRIQTKPTSDDPRRRLYSEPDVERLASSSRAARRPSAVAASSIAWGEPMLPSAISTVHAGKLLYRGRDAVEWSGVAMLEDVAAVLWRAPRDLLDAADAPPALTPGASAKEDCLSMLAHLASRTATSLDQYEDERRRTAAATLHTVAAASGRCEWRAGEPVHVYLARSWQAPAAVDVLRRALVLLADHELNVSTFAARVTASTGSPLPACVLSGMCALVGPRHGGAGQGVQALVDRHRSTGRDADMPLEQPPGFGHPLYAGMDIRATALLDSFAEPERHARTRAWVADKFGLAPNVDYALSALTARFRLPSDAPLLIFAVARTVGWLAHALEQIQNGDLIRPRATYIGPLRWSEKEGDRPRLEQFLPDVNRRRDSQAG